MEYADFHGVLQECLRHPWRLVHGTPQLPDGDVVGEGPSQIVAIWDDSHVPKEGFMGFLDGLLWKVHPNIPYLQYKRVRSSIEESLVVESLVLVGAGLLAHKKMTFVPVLRVYDSIFFR